MTTQLDKMKEMAEAENERLLRVMRGTKHKVAGRSLVWPVGKLRKEILRIAATRPVWIINDFQNRIVGVPVERIQRALDTLVKLGYLEGERDDGYTFYSIPRQHTFDFSAPEPVQKRRLTWKRNS